MKAITAHATQFKDVYDLLEGARQWHLANHPQAWPVFSQDAVRKDIEEGRVFLFADGSDYVATLTVTETDPLIWEDADVPALYLHKLTSRRDRGGQGIGSFVIGWAKSHALAQQKKFLRLDTWGANMRLKAYYESQGFLHSRVKSFPVDTPLPDHYRGASMNLFEMRLSPQQGHSQPAVAQLLAAS